MVRVEIGENPPSRLDKALSRDVPEAAALSRSRIARLIGAGQVRRLGSAAPVTDQKARAAPGEIYEIAIPEAAETHMEPEAIPLAILFEDEDLIVIDKPAGMVVHPAPGTPSGTLVNALLHHFGGHLSGVGGRNRPGIVHRIDKDTSGLLVVAKSDAAHQGLAAQFERHSMERHYKAIVHGVPEASDPRLRGLRGVSFEPGDILKITSGLARHKTDRQRQAVYFGSGRHAVTRARTIERFGTPPAAALLDCWLETGRTHQIRVHLAHAGHGIIGDPVYGGRRRLSPRAVGEAGAAAARAFPRQALHAASLGFIHPVSGAEMRFRSPLPDDMKSLINALGGLEKHAGDT